MYGDDVCATRRCPPPRYGGPNRGVRCLAAALCLLLALAAPARPESTPLSLADTVQEALRASPALRASLEGITGAEASKNRQRSQFLPTLSAHHRYTHHYEVTGFALGPDLAFLNPEDTFTFTTTLSQPLFTGFSLITGYRMADIQVRLARLEEARVRQNVMLDAKQAYYSVLQTERLLEVARQGVTQLAAHKEVAGSFYEVGMIPRNDLLKAEVELANMHQELIVARNNLEMARSRFNAVLFRPLDASVSLEGILGHGLIDMELSTCLETAARERPVIRAARLQLELARQDVTLAKAEYYPTVTLRGNYYKVGTDLLARGGKEISDPDSWQVDATASWNLWEWGRTHHGVQASRSRVAQEEHRLALALKTVELEVKEAFLKLQEAEQNIGAVDKAIEQAEENFRISKERYQAQAGTSTDVLDARTLLTRTRTNYYNALYAYNLAKATLYRAMGVEIME